MPSPPGLPPRRAAWRVLLQVRDGRPYDEALDEALADLAGADRRLAHELAAGCLRAAAALDRALAPCVTGGLGRVDPPIHELLRLGAYQLTGLDRIPPHAAVGTAVALAREAGGGRAAPFVNAVLRKVAADAPRLVPGRGTHPGWLVHRWTARFGADETSTLMAWNDTRPRLAVQPARWSRERLAEAWAAAGVAWDPAPWEAGLLPREAGHPTELPGYREGGFQVQDPAQRLLAEYFHVPAGAAVYDACAAPGGKAVLLSRRAALVIAGDPKRSRVSRLAENLRRAASGRAFAVAADARFPPVRELDAVVLDVPCLGTGVLARRPDLRWRTRPEALARLAAQAGDLLRAAAGRVRAGGLLCFSTCSLEPEENAVQIERFLEDDPRFAREPGPAPAAFLTPAGDFESLPQRHGVDGAYAARLRRRG